MEKYHELAWKLHKEIDAWIVADIRKADKIISEWTEQAAKKIKLGILKCIADGDSFTNKDIDTILGLTPDPVKELAKELEEKAKWGKLDSRASSLVITNWHELARLALEWRDQPSLEPNERV